MKKFMFFLLVPIFCGFAVHSNAQSEVLYWESIWTFGPNCDGEVDVITGPVHGYVVNHYNPVTGVFEWYKFNILSAELVSQTTGELFSISGKDQGKTEGDFGDPNVVGDLYLTSFRNLRGNQGSHYLVKVIWFFDASTNTWTQIRADIKCL